VKNFWQRVQRTPQSLNTHRKSLHNPIQPYFFSSFLDKVHAHTHRKLKIHRLVSFPFGNVTVPGFCHLFLIETKALFSRLAITVSGCRLQCRHLARALQESPVYSDNAFGEGLKALALDFSELQNYETNVHSTECSWWKCCRGRDWRFNNGCVDRQYGCTISSPWGFAAGIFFLELPVPVCAGSRCPS
jgi:hypothetical protein